MTAVLYGLIAMLAGGTANALLKRVVGHFGPIEAAALRALISSVTLFILFFIFQPSVTLNAEAFGYAILISILGYFPFMFFVLGLEKGKVGVVAPVSSGWIAIASVFGFLFLGDIFTYPKAIVVAVVLFGIVLASVDLKDFRNSSLFSFQTGMPYAILSALLWGIVFPLFKVGAALLGGLVFSFLVETIVSLCAFSHLLLLGKNPIKIISRELMDPSALRALLLAGVLTPLFTLSMSFGYQTGQVSLLSALGGSSIIVTILVAAYLYGERLTRLQYTGASFVLLGVLLTAII